MKHRYLLPRWTLNSSNLTVFYKHYEDDIVLEQSNSARKWSTTNEIRFHWQMVRGTTDSSSDVAYFTRNFWTDGSSAYVKDGDDVNGLTYDAQTTGNLNVDFVVMHRNGTDRSVFFQGIRSTKTLIGDNLFKDTIDDIIPYCHFDISNFTSFFKSYLNKTNIIYRDLTNDEYNSLEVSMRQFYAYDRTASRYKCSLNSANGNYHFIIPEPLEFKHFVQELIKLPNTYLPVSNNFDEILKALRTDHGIEMPKIINTASVKTMLLDYSAINKYVVVPNSISDTWSSYVSAFKQTLIATGKSLNYYTRNNTGVAVINELHNMTSENFLNGITVPGNNKVEIMITPELDDSELKVITNERFY